MLRLSPHVATAVGIAAAVTLATPALASAHTTEPAAHIGVNNLSGAHAIYAGKPFAPLTQPLKTTAFPSADSTVVASIGFIDDYQVGYFWTNNRDGQGTPDSVEQTVPGPHKVKKAVLKLDVTDNGLTSGAEVDWTLSLNGTDVGSFVISEGQTGPVTEKFKFPKIAGGSYDAKIRVTNNVPSGDGAIALRYAGDGPHSINLKK